MNINKIWDRECVPLTVASNINQSSGLKDLTMKTRV